MYIRNNQCDFNELFSHVAMLWRLVFFRTTTLDWMRYFRLSVSLLCRNKNDVALQFLEFPQFLPGLLLETATSIPASLSKFKSLSQNLNR